MAVRNLLSQTLKSLPRNSTRTFPLHRGITSPVRTSLRRSYIPKTMSETHSGKVLREPNPLILDPQRNKGTAFTEEERNQLNIVGSLPSKVESLATQADRLKSLLPLFTTPLSKYAFLCLIKQQNTSLFYELVIRNMQDLLPIIYTPTIGDVCTQLGPLWNTADCLYISLNDEGRIEQILKNWPIEPEIIVVSDGSRILGLGDLGVNGKGIPIGKISLYVAAGGFHPSNSLPVIIDVGTNNESLLNDPHYLGLKQKRPDDEKYNKLMDEFLMAVKKVWPTSLLQFEDFSNDHCFDLLENYQDKLLCFNDDIQGTGAVIAAGFYNACKLSLPMKSQRIVVIGAGSAGIGVVDQIVGLMEENGIDHEAAKEQIWMIDSRGLLTTKRNNLTVQKQRYARKDAKEIYVQGDQAATLLEVVKESKATAIIGLSGIPRSITREVVQEMSKHTERPVIFPLSNPTSKSECTAKEAVEWSDGKCIFASGSPFDPVEHNGKTVQVSQGNNMYIFPGLGLGAFLCQASKVTDSMLSSSSQCLAESVSPEDLKKGFLYPPLSEIREISAKIAAAVISRAVDEGIAKNAKKLTVNEIREKMYSPSYTSLSKL